MYLCIHTYIYMYIDMYWHILHVCMYINTHSLDIHMYVSLYLHICHGCVIWLNYLALVCSNAQESDLLRSLFQKMCRNDS